MSGLSVGSGPPTFCARRNHAPHPHVPLPGELPWPSRRYVRLLPAGCLTSSERVGQPSLLAPPSLLVEDQNLAGPLCPASERVRWVHVEGPLGPPRRHPSPGWPRPGTSSAIHTLLCRRRCCYQQSRCWAPTGCPMSAQGTIGHPVSKSRFAPPSGATYPVRDTTDGRPHSGRPRFLWCRRQRRPEAAAEGRSTDPGHRRFPRRASGARRQRALSESKTVSPGKLASRSEPSAELGEC